MADDNVNVKFGATVDGAISGINQITQKLEAFGANIEGLKSPLAALGEAAAAAFAVEKIEQWTDKVVDAGVDLARLEAQTGLSAQQANVLAFAAENTDSQISLLSRTMTQFGRIAEESMVTPTSNSARALAAMGINVKELVDNGKNMNDIFNITIAKLATYKDSMNKSAIEAQVMGGRSTQLALALRDLGENYKEMDDRVKASGVTLAGFDTASRETKEEMVETGMATQGLSEQLYMHLKPAIDAVIIGWTFFKEGINDSLGSGTLGTLIDLGLVLPFKGLASGIAFCSNVLIDFYQGIQTLVAKGTIGVDMLVIKFEELYAAITRNAPAMAALKKEYEDDKVAWNEASNDFNAGVNKRNDALDKFMNKLWGVADAEKKVNEAGVVAPTTTADPKAAMDADIEAHRKMLEEELALVGQNLQARMILQQQYYDWLRQKYPQDANALASAGKQIAQTQNQEAKQSEASWNRFFNGFNSGIMGMLRGTTSFKQAFQSMLGNAVEFALKAIEKMVAHWIGSEITKTAATNAGNAARISSDVAGAAASKAAQKAADSTSVMSSAKTAAAGAYSATAAIPIIGPILAPAAAAVAFGATMAFDSFETGTPYVPKTGPYLLHEGEEVRPAGVQSAGGGGGVHFHVSAMDSKSVAQFFETHGSAIAKQVTEQFKRGNSTFRPRS